MFINNTKIIKSLLFVNLSFVLVKCINAQLPLVKLGTYSNTDSESDITLTQSNESTNAILIHSKYIAALLPEKDSKNYTQAYVQFNLNGYSRYFITKRFKQKFSIKNTNWDIKDRNLTLYILQLDRPMREIQPVNFGNFNLIRNHFKNKDIASSYEDYIHTKHFPSFIVSFENLNNVPIYRFTHYYCNIEPAVENLYTNIEYNFQTENDDFLFTAKCDLTITDHLNSAGLFVFHEKKFLFFGMVIDNISNDREREKRFLILNPSIIENCLDQVIAQTQNQNYR